MLYVWWFAQSAANASDIKILIQSKFGDMEGNPDQNLTKILSISKFWLSLIFLNIARISCTYADIKRKSTISWDINILIVNLVSISLFFLIVLLKYLDIISFYDLIQFIINIFYFLAIFGINEDLIKQVLDFIISFFN